VILKIKINEFIAFAAFQKKHWQEVPAELLTKITPGLLDRNVIIFDVCFFIK